MGVVVFGVFMVFVLWLISLAYFAGKTMWDIVFFIWIGLPVAGAILLGHVTLSGVDRAELLSWVPVLLYGAGAAIAGMAMGAIWRSLWHSETYQPHVDD